MRSSRTNTIQLFLQSLQHRANFEMLHPNCVSTHSSSSQISVSVWENAIVTIKMVVENRFDLHYSRQLHKNGREWTTSHKFVSHQHTARFRISEWQDGTISVRKEEIFASMLRRPLTRLQSFCSTVTQWKAISCSSFTRRKSKSSTRSVITDDCTTYFRFLVNVSAPILMDRNSSLWRNVIHPSRHNNGTGRISTRVSF